MGLLFKIEFLAALNVKYTVFWYVVEIGRRYGSVWRLQCRRFM